MIFIDNTKKKKKGKWNFIQHKFENIFHKASNELILKINK
jgi:hypothetical protein